MFSLRSGAALARRVGAQLGCAPSAHEEREFEDGEHKTRPLVAVRGRDVYLVQSLYGEPDMGVGDKLCRALFFLGALRDAGAARVTAVVPYLCFARKDRKTKPRDPVTTRYVAGMFHAVGVDRVVTVDVHNLAAFHNAFRMPTEHLEARPVLAAELADLLDGVDATVVAPDAGGVHRAEAFRATLERLIGRPVTAAFAEKRRSEGVVTGSLFAGEVRDRAAIIVDDLVAGGTTLRRTADACRERGATAVYAAVTHAMFAGAASVTAVAEAVDALVLGDTIPLERAGRIERAALDRITVVDLAPLLGEAIHRLHTGGSVVELAEPHPADPLRDAGRRLGRRLDDARREGPLVMAIARAGIPVGYEIALRLGAPMDAVFARRLVAPDDATGVGTVALGGPRWIDRDAAARAGLSEQDAERLADRELRALEELAQRLRGDRPLPPLRGRSVIVVDDAIVTGATVEAAVRALRERDVASVRVATPLCASAAADRLHPLVDGLEALELVPAAEAWRRHAPELAPHVDDRDLGELMERAQRAAGVDLYEGMEMDG